MDFDIRIDPSKDCDKIFLSDPTDLNGEYNFLNPSRALLRNLKNKGLLDKCFSVVIDGGGVCVESLFHIVEYRNQSKNKKLTLEHICKVSDLEEWRIK